MSEPVPDIDELLFDMDSLHQQLLNKGIIGARLVDSFMESLDKLSDQDKLRKVQRRIPLLTAKQAHSRMEAKSAKNCRSSPCQTPLVQPMSNRNLLNLLLDSPGEYQNTPRCSIRLKAFRQNVFQRWWCYEQMCKPGGHRLKLPDLYFAYESQQPWTQQPGMRHISLPAAIKNQHLFQKELDDAVKTRNICKATITIGSDL